MAELPKIAKPAERALRGAEIQTLEQLALRSEAEVAALHGMGPKALAQLRAAMTERGLRFSDGPKNVGARTAERRGQRARNHR